MQRATAYATVTIDERCAVLSSETLEGCGSQVRVYSVYEACTESLISAFLGVGSGVRAPVNGARHSGK